MSSAFEALCDRVNSAAAIEPDTYAWLLTCNTRVLRLKRLRRGSWDTQDYALTLDRDDHLTCSCPDYQRRGRELGLCKHTLLLHEDAARITGHACDDETAFRAVSDSVYRSMLAARNHPSLS